ncbi:hypothetical protein MAM1_0019c01699 [Mucor ambiguus]|uniref:Arrestin-like N-terminal domain-containing protein n=1 Tax=Mucor ambiguus TaxID=91626 RepID=A0A0C9MKC8_9FUNG|nr:hypothetical protein MAM1_0019c01699 [Mucor ambiguus]
MDCCHDSEECNPSSSSSQDLVTILSNLPQQYVDMSPYEPQPQGATKMKVSLDLPGYEEYLPTYLPGQQITGQVKLQNESPIKVSHLRIALFGNVQVYGDRPGHPMTNGLFDYQRNEQLINSGLSIVKQSTPDDEDEQQLVCKRDDNSQETKRQKTAQDRHIEKLIRKVAVIDHTTHFSHGILSDVPTMLVHGNNQEDTAFELDSNSYQIQFSVRVPTSRRLSGTFDHPHYPISYRIVVIMKYKDQGDASDNEVTCYSTVKLCLEPFFNLNQFKSRIQTSPSYQYVQNKDTVWNSICTQFLNCGIMTMYTSKQQKHLSHSSIEAHLELSKQAFERSQYIPLQVKLTNHAFSNFNISVVKINVDFVRHINMTCSMNEQVELQTIQSTTIVFKSSQEQEQQLFFKHALLTFDLSNHIRIPTDSVCTIFSAATKDVFSLGYDLKVSMDITGVTATASNSTTADLCSLSLNQEKYYMANQPHHIWHGDESHQDLPPEPYHHKFKTYTLKLDPLAVIVVGHSEY